MCDDYYYYGPAKPIICRYCGKEFYPGGSNHDDYHCPGCGKEHRVFYQKIQVYTCDHLHYTEHFHVGTRDDIARVAHQSLSSIIEWHKTLIREKDDLLKNGSLTHYIVFNRMENIKRVLSVFRDNGELDEDLATNYAVIHMIIEHDITDKEKLTFPNIYILFKEYIMATYDCLNFVNGGHHPTSNELIGITDQINKSFDRDDKMSR